MIIGGQKQPNTSSADSLLQAAYKTGNTQSITTALQNDEDTYAAQYGSDSLQQFQNHVAWVENEAGVSGDKTTQDFLSTLSNWDQDIPLLPQAGGGVQAGSTPPDMAHLDASQYDESRSSPSSHQ